MISLALTSEAKNWDLFLDNAGNIAVISGPEAVAQDVACALKTFLGEVYFDITLGIPYFEQVLGRAYSLPLIQALMNAQALGVPGVVQAQTEVLGYAGRRLTGNVKFIDTTGQILNAHF
jgi:hypothetical protein